MGSFLPRGKVLKDRGLVNYPAGPGVILGLLRSIQRTTDLRHNAPITAIAIPAYNDRNRSTIAIRNAGRRAARADLTNRVCEFHALC